ncbi:MAG TPA: hypothetical protein DEF16_02045 [Gemmobacter sp.]|nr:hypothetical protein [Gemmobacter sp.]
MATAKKAGRRPADQGGDGRQDMWAALRATPETITVSAIANQTGIHRSTVLRYLQALTAGGYLDACPAAVGQAGSWRLVRNVGHHAPRVRRDGSPVTQGEVTGQLWLAMVGLKDFDCHDLIQNASIEIPEATAKDYCKRLLAAGYLRVLVKADPHLSRVARYRLIRSSGPKAPPVQRVRQIYDPNTGAVYALEGGL